MLPDRQHGCIETNHTSADKVILLGWVINIIGPNAKGSKKILQLLICMCVTDYYVLYFSKFNARKGYYITRVEYQNASSITKVLTNNRGHHCFLLCAYCLSKTSSLK